jgi:hypothetical protein
MSGPVSGRVREEMERLIWTLGIVAACVLLAYALLRGWRSRAARQGGIAAPPGAPAALGAELVPPLAGVYVATTTAGSWQDRIVVHGLGRRARVRARLHPEGALLDRDGDEPIFLPIADIRAVTTAPGIAGKVMGLPEGVLVITWALGGSDVDSGIRADDPLAQAGWIDAARAALAVRERPGVSPTHGRAAPGSPTNSGAAT